MWQATSCDMQQHQAISNIEPACLVKLAADVVKQTSTLYTVYAGSEGDIDASKQLGYEALLKHTEALQLNSMKQDRARLIHVAERLVKLAANTAMKLLIMLLFMQAAKVTLMPARNWATRLC